MHNILSRIMLPVFQFAVGAVVGTALTLLAVIFLGDYAMLGVMALVAFCIIGYSHAD